MTQRHSEIMPKPPDWKFPGSNFTYSLGQDFGPNILTIPLLTFGLNKIKRSD